MAHFRKYLLLSFIFLFAFWQNATAQHSDREKKDLNYFVGQAMKASPLIKDFGNQLLMNKIDGMRLKSGYLPQVTASSTGLYAPRINGYGFDEVITNGQSLDALLNVNYAIIGKAMRANQTQGLKLQQDSLDYAIGMARLDLRKAITEQYIQAYDSQQQVAFNLDIFKLLEKEESLLKELTTSNVYKQTEYITFLVTFKQQQLQYRQAELQFNTDLAALNYLAGVKDSTSIVLSEPTLKQNTVKHPVSNFFVKRFEIDSLKAINEREAIEFNYKPKVGVYINGGYNSSLVLQPYKNFGASVGFTIAVPIYDGHQKKMQQDKVSLLASTVSGYSNFFLGQQEQQIRMLYQQIEATGKLLAQIDEQVKLSRGLIEVDSKLLHTGDIRIADFVIAINNYMAARNALQQTNINRLKLINQLNYWNP